MSILNALGDEKPGLYEVLHSVTTNLGKNPVSEVWNYKILSLGGGRFIDIIDLN
ncbi:MULTISPECIES: hypothetical protein [unclassified Microcoleus]|uniref:hypothetical protein n=1 Tax=unclassified Microcoleus TaxID=2642155 RepID=UPI001D23C36B|nr:MULTISPECIES: hypothetical protein [unclassified Microcoleus]MCC3413808.1 hypothetical protein [Microcoleus sp. PH2017_02_FOX_O_A]MCC3517680.1 hypothetical protein [Microcoleus sp. PH2017_18_LLB_O_A]